MEKKSDSIPELELANDSQRARLRELLSWVHSGVSQYTSLCHFHLSGWLCVHAPHGFTFYAHLSQCSNKVLNRHVLLLWRRRGRSQACSYSSLTGVSQPASVAAMCRWPNHTIYHRWNLFTVQTLCRLPNIARILVIFLISPSTDWWYLTGES